MYFRCLIKYWLTYVPLKNLNLEPFHSEYYIIWDIILKDLLSNYERSWLIMCLKCCNFFSYSIHIIFAGLYVVSRFKQTKNQCLGMDIFINIFLVTKVDPGSQTLPYTHATSYY